MAGGAVNAAIFAAGALLGGGIATVVASRRRDTQALPPRPAPPAVVHVDRSSGQAKFSEPSRDVALVQPLPPVLRNGHPGVCQ